MGGKYKLLPQIIPLFPEHIGTFVDLFGGGFNVGVNVKANLVWYNDIQEQVVGMLKYFKSQDLTDILYQIDQIIAKFQLSKENQTGFIELRKLYNSFNPFDDDYEDEIMLYVLICFAFNNQIRFNSKKEYNMPFGKNRSSFNPTLREKLILFINKLNDKNVKFSTNNFNDFNISELTDNDLVYCDPPYFNSTATYNENGGWTQQNENDLLDILNELNSKGLRFALSNNLTTNPSLET